ncbi:hypothetical protein AUP68_04184 [Ilyonectria robusta]
MRFCLAHLVHLCQNLGSQGRSHGAPLLLICERPDSTPDCIFAVSYRIQRRSASRLLLRLSVSLGIELRSTKSWPSIYLKAYCYPPDGFRMASPTIAQELATPSSKLCGNSVTSAELEYSSHQSWSGGCAASRESRFETKCEGDHLGATLPLPCARVQTPEIAHLRDQLDTLSTPYRPARPCEVIDLASGRQVPPLISCQRMSSI